MNTDTDIFNMALFPFVDLIEDTFGIPFPLSLTDYAIYHSIKDTDTEIDTYLNDLKY